MNTRRNAAYNIAYRMFSIFLPLVTAPYLSRVVGQQGVGLYAYAWSISYLFVLLGMLGLADYGVRAIAAVKDQPAELNRTFSEIYTMQLLVAGLTLAAWFVYVFVFARAEQTIALHLTMMSVSCLVNIDWCLMGLDQFKPIALRNTAVKLIAAACIFLFVRSPADLWIYALAWSLATLIGCMLCWPLLRGKLRLTRVPFRGALRHLWPCAVLFLSVLAVNIYRTMDKVMVGGMAGMAENGLYENAEKIIYCLSGLISAVGTVMLPKATFLLQRGEEGKVRQSIRTTMDLILCLTCGMAFGLAAVSAEFAPLFYGADFARSGDMMIPLGFTLICIGLANVIRTQWILPQKRDHLFVISVVSGAVVNLIANLLLIPRLHAMGAVVGTLLAESAVPLIQYLYLRKELPYRGYLLSLLGYSLIGGVMLLALRLAAPLLPGGGWLHLALQVILGAAVYGGLSLLLWIAEGRKDLLRLIPGVKLPPSPRS